MLIEDVKIDIRTQEILFAASNHDLETLKPFLRVPGAASVQDTETGFTPLHAAIAACGPKTLKYPDVRKADSVRNGMVDGHGDELKDRVEDEEVDIEKAKTTVKELFLSGAIWNDLDTNDETPGCLAWRLGQKELYGLVVEAGVRAELLMNLMGAYEPLPDDDSDDGTGKEDEESAVYGEVDIRSNTESQEESSTQIPTVIPEEEVNSETYLKSDLTFADDKLIDSDANGVMMAWEASIMRRSASLIAPHHSLRILNVGFGLGIIDSFFKEAQPSIHHIIEAHPSVISKLSDSSTSSTPKSKSHYHEFGPKWLDIGAGNNVIHQGKWQDICPKLISEGLVFDAIYFDTFAEPYLELKSFFSEYVIELLAPEGRFSFFNGMGADRRVCYDVYTRVVECDLIDAGLDVEWVDVDVDLGSGNNGLGTDGEGEWKGIRRRYWTLEKYRLPVSKFLR